MNDLIVVENLNPAMLFKDGGMDNVLREIERKATGWRFDMNSDSDRKECASVAHRVARSKTLLDDMGKALVADQKKEIKKVDHVRKGARDFLDRVKAEVRAPLTEWERLDMIRQVEEEAKERVLIQAKIDELQKYEKIMSFVDVATLSDAEYRTILNEAIQEATEKIEREAKEKAEREAEEKRLEKERLELEYKRKEQEEREAVLKAEQDKIDAERKTLEDDKRKEQERTEREAFEKQAAENARIQAEKDAKEKAGREVAELDRQKALMPDKKKILVSTEYLMEMPMHEITDPELNRIFQAFWKNLKDRIIKLHDEVGIEI